MTELEDSDDNSDEFNVMVRICHDHFSSLNAASQ